MQLLQRLPSPPLDSSPAGGLQRQTGHVGPTPGPRLPQPLTDRSGNGSPARATEAPPPPPPRGWRSGRCRWETQENQRRDGERSGLSGVFLIDSGARIRCYFCPNAKHKMKHIYSYKPPNRCNDAQFSGRRTYENGRETYFWKYTIYSPVYFPPFFVMFSFSFAS